MDAIDLKIKSLKESENLSHQNFIKGLTQIILLLDTFLNTTSLENANNFYVKVYNVIHLKSDAILRMISKFQGKE